MLPLALLLLPLLLVVVLGARRAAHSCLWQALDAVAV